MKICAENKIRPKLVARIFGGIGNQLFCYAAARRLAFHNNAELIIDDISGFTYDKTYKRQYQLDHFSIPCRKATKHELLEPFSKIRRAVKRLGSKFKRYEQRSYVTQDGVDFDCRLLEFRLKGTVYLDGYWQSEKYFKDIEGIIRKDLQIEFPKDELNLNMANRMQECNSIGIHVRFFDDPNSGSINHYKSYYKNAIEIIDSSVPSPKYFVFSDCPELAYDCLPLPRDRFLFIDHNKGDACAYADLWLMTQCRHFIIANSTFSWWGAWLSINKNKIVIAPKLSHSKSSEWGFSGLIPSEWIKL